MWPESSPVNVVNLVKKIGYNYRDIDFFLGDYFLLARPVDIEVRDLFTRYYYKIRSINLHGNSLRCLPP